jgi:hypothetical protein
MTNTLLLIGWLAFGAVILFYAIPGVAANVKHPLSDH